MKPGVYLTRRCLFCTQEIPEIAWRDDQPGGHLVFVHESGGIRFAGGAWTPDGTVRIVARENVRLMLCRDLTTVAATRPSVADRLEPPRSDVPPRPWAGVRAFWRWVAERTRT